MLNFPSADIYDKCSATIRNNGYDDDEITLSGLTAEPAQTVNAPRIRECFLNLECEFLWEKERHEGDDSVVMCVWVKHVAMDGAHLDEKDIGRYAESGYIYNIHNPVNPLSGFEEGYSLGMLRKIKRDR